MTAYELLERGGDMGDIMGKPATTAEALGSGVGLLVKPEYLKNRRSNAHGIVHHWVAGHGGDAFWFEHDDGTVAVYLTDELVMEGQ